MFRHPQDLDPRDMFGCGVPLVPFPSVSGTGEGQIPQDAVPFNLRQDAGRGHGRAGEIRLHEGTHQGEVSGNATGSFIVRGVEERRLRRGQPVVRSVQDDTGRHLGKRGQRALTCQSQCRNDPESVDLVRSGVSHSRGVGPGRHLRRQFLSSGGCQELGIADSRRGRLTGIRHDDDPDTHRTGESPPADLVHSGNEQMPLGDTPLFLSQVRHRTGSLHGGLGHGEGTDEKTSEGLLIVWNRPSGHRTMKERPTTFDIGTVPSSLFWL
jgi:hypothetical protein